MILPNCMGCLCSWVTWVACVRGAWLRDGVGQIVAWAEWVTWIDKFWCKSMSFWRGLKLAVSLKIDMGLKFDVGLKLCESQDVQALTFFKLIFRVFL